MSLDTGIQRLLFLAEFLKTVPEEKFDLEVWRFSKVSHEATDELLNTNCGTAACAVGWACAIPEFQNLGLQYLDSRPQLFDGEDCWEDWDAVEEFFELDRGNALYLFYHTAYPMYGVTVENVISRIHEYCSTQITKS